MNMLFGTVLEPILTHQGITSFGILHGFLGITSLLFLAYIFSANRKAIPWKTVGFGLLLQLFLALCILKIGWVQGIFNAIGKVFVSILDFTAAGSVFLFGDLMNTDSYGFIFVFQILPTIVFFCCANVFIVLLRGIAVFCKNTSQRHIKNSQHIWSRKPFCNWKYLLGSN